MAIKSYRYRIYPSKRQAQILNDQLGLCCELYNAALQERRDAWKLEHKSITWFDQNYQLPEIRALRPDLRAAHNDILRSTLRRADLAFKAFFRRARAGEKPGYPRFRSFRRYNSMTFQQVGNCLIGSTVLRVPKMGKVKIRLSRSLGGPIRTLTIKREAGRWFAIFACEVEAKPLPFNPNTVGIDLGLTSFVTLSDGTAIDNPRHHQEAKRQLRVAHRRVARRKKGSNRRRKAVMLLQRIHVHVRNQRADFHHKLSRRIIDNFGLIAVEDLNIKGLASGLFSKSVNDAGWSQFLFMLSYKAESAGRLLVKVDPRGTSQTCICGAEVRKTLKDRWHLCLNCGLSASRDHVSALVILGRASRLQAQTSPVAECVA